MINMSTKFDKETRNGVVSIVFTRSMHGRNHGRTDGLTDGTTAALLYPHRNALRGDNNKYKTHKPYGKVKVFHCHKDYAYKIWMFYLEGRLMNWYCIQLWIRPVLFSPYRDLKLPILNPLCIIQFVQFWICPQVRGQKGRK